MRRNMRIAAVVVTGLGASVVVSAPTTSPSTLPSTTYAAPRGQWPDDQKLRDAVELGDSVLISKLIDAGADINGGAQPALLSAIAANHFAVGRLLLERGASPDSANKLRMLRAVLGDQHRAA